MLSIGRDDYLSMESMEKICKALGVGIGDVMEFVDSLPEKTEVV